MKYKIGNYYPDVISLFLVCFNEFTLKSSIYDLDGETQRGKRKREGQSRAWNY